VSTNNFTKDVLIRFEFGQFGNYGSQLVVKIENETPMLALENWAYGETFASITTTEGVNSKKLAQLGKELIQAALKLEEREKVAK